MSQRSPLPSGTPVPETDCLSALRRTTKESHAQLDASLPLGRADASLEDYRHHTLALSAWLTALQPHLAALESLVPGFDFARPARLHALHADWLATHAAPPHAKDGFGDTSGCTQEMAAQAFSAFGAPGHAAVCWGLAYVVEGSQLGGQFLYQRLAPRLAPHPLRYLQGLGAGTGLRWKHFTRLLDTHVQSRFDIQAACAGARAGFDGLRQQLQGQGVLA
ncbi:biliverdin-producing heme oxygenase [Acidovorax sp. SUPP2539]|uniref:biliverdin-producing heme oxygenase n=1 Tax=Acidovorax sp. SUPP2539 TaxID=2920878 RepID=UPI0023DE1CB9|nr:biliverdin-producing heme oxygenase [Acidovorax sp. SUPP2539]GKS89148.1 biliverdin-producing heme oxygenase [Acidovorax sp. SUPP2539]